MWLIHCEIHSLYVVYNCPVLLTANLSESDTKVFRSTHLIIESESGLSTARSAQLNWLTSTYAFTEKTWLRLLSLKASFFHEDVFNHQTSHNTEEHIVFVCSDS